MVQLVPRGNAVPAGSGASPPQALRPVCADTTGRAKSSGLDETQLQREQSIALAQTRQFHELRDHWATLFEEAGSDGPEISEGYVTECLALFRLASANAVLDAWEKDFPGDAGHTLYCGG